MPNVCATPLPLPYAQKWLITSDKMSSQMHRDIPNTGKNTFILATTPRFSDDKSY